MRVFSTPSAAELLLSKGGHGHIGRLMEGHGSSLPSGGDTHSVWFGNLANTVLTRGHSRCVLHNVESEPASVNTTEIIWQQSNVSFRRYPTTDLMSAPVDTWWQDSNVEWVFDVVGGKNARVSIAGAVPLGLAQMMGQQRKNLQKGGGGWITWALTCAVIWVLVHMKVRRVSHWSAWCTGSDAEELKQVPHPC